MLTDTQTQALRAAVDRIIPADAYPGGWDAGVGEYFAQLFMKEPRFLPRYRQGLDAFESEAHAAFGHSFASLTPGQQDGLLTAFDAGDAPEFMRLLVAQAMEGFYADPGNGGNRNEIAWHMIGYKITV